MHVESQNKIQVKIFQPRSILNFLCLSLSHNYSYGQLTQIHPEVDEYKLAYAQVCETRKVFVVNFFLLMMVRFYTPAQTHPYTHTKTFVVILYG